MGPEHGQEGDMRRGWWMEGNPAQEAETQVAAAFPNVQVLD
jgi:hypothetical protein